MDYICPTTKEILTKTSQGLRRSDAFIYPFIDIDEDQNFTPIPNFLVNNFMSHQDLSALQSYDNKNSINIYKNFLNWLFATFEEDEFQFRNKMISKLALKPGNKVLVTGCGLGDDLEIIAQQIGPNGMIYCQDISKVMVCEAQRLFQLKNNHLKQIYFSVSNALSLPFRDQYFDAAFHFGRINLFGNLRKSVAEMNRVVKSGGKVMFGDEGIAPWIKNEEYAKIAICNNKLWSRKIPLSILPKNSKCVNCSWVLGNCFYLIEFEVSNSEPFMNIDIPHQGSRGGTARTRYFGQLEGVSPSTKNQVIAAASEENLSIHN